LILAHAAVAARSCADCKRYVYNDGPGEDHSQVLRPDRHGRRTLPMARPVGQPTPCWTCPKVPAGADPVPDSAREFTPQLWRTWMHNRGCKAVGRWPDDPIVVEHAREVAEVEAAIERSRWATVEALARLAATFLGAR
jgi:hypothetical protein